ncbi:MAG: nucleotidyltransferase domain-containing protein [Anaerolineae bacterium]|nr:nucleotidyltransferase domain-containing protein [Anaerolineae bacterium]
MTLQTHLSPEKIARYRATALKRQAQAAAEVSQRRQKAWQIARQAADLLRKEFGVNRVVVFGSLARETGFTRWSDIDIAVWGWPRKILFALLGLLWICR